MPVESYVWIPFAGSLLLIKEQIYSLLNKVLKLVVIDVKYCKATLQPSIFFILLRRFVHMAHNK